MIGPRAAATSLKTWVWFLFWTIVFSFGFYGLASDRRSYRNAAKPFRDLPVIYNADKSWYEPARCP